MRAMESNNESREQNIIEGYSDKLIRSLENGWITPYGDFSGVCRHSKEKTPTEKAIALRQQANAALIYGNKCVICTKEVVARSDTKNQVLIITSKNRYESIDLENRMPEPNAIIFGDYYIVPVLIGEGRRAERKIAVVNLNSKEIIGFLKDEKGDDKTFNDKLPKIVFDATHNILFVCAKYQLYVYKFTGSKYDPFRYYGNKQYLTGAARFCDVIINDGNLFFVFFRELSTKYYLISGRIVNSERGKDFYFEGEDKSLFIGKCPIKVFALNNEIYIISSYNRQEDIIDGNLYLYTINLQKQDEFTGRFEEKSTILTNNLQAFDNIDLVKIIDDVIFILGHRDNNYYFLEHIEGGVSSTPTSIDRDIVPFTLIDKIPCLKDISNSSISVHIDNNGLHLYRN